MGTQSPPPAAAAGPGGVDLAADHGPGIRPPAAPRRPSVTAVHGERRVDDWAWLRDRDDPAVLAHLRAENAYTDASTAHLAALREQLFTEIRSRIAETDLTVPVRKGPWWYYQRTVEGKDYLIHCRLPVEGPGRDPATPPDAPPGAPPGTPWPDEQVVLDENALARELEAGEPREALYLDVANLAVSPDHRILAFAVDSTGDERFSLRFHNLDGGGDPPESIDGVSYGVAWASDGATIFYTRPDAANRPAELWRHRVGTDPATDVLVYREDDERFHVGVRRSKDGAYVLLELHSKVTSEVHVLPSDHPEATFAVFAPRREGVEYSIEPHGDHVVVLTNDGAENFRALVAPVPPLAARARTAPRARETGANEPSANEPSANEPSANEPSASDWAPSDGRRWRELIAHRPDVRLEGLEVFARHLVAYERAGAETRIRVYALPADDPWSAPLSEGWLVPVAESPSASWGGANPEFDSATLRYEYSSLVTPRTVFDLDLDSGRAVLRKQQPVLGGYRPSDYVTQRLWAPAPDGTRVPVSIVRHATTPLDGSAPCLLYGYGAYEHSVDPVFSSIRLSLLDRGFVFAIAHVRGGGELGRRWYEEGKLLAKPNTFHDFLAAARALVDGGWTRPERLVARGGSAGGLLMGAVANLAPDLFRAIVAEVPFVDCLTTMLDPTLPLTVIEYDEWGDPATDPVVYRTMRSYAPYDNVRPGHYPDMLVTAGLEDPRVGYWEPAKWVQKLRAADPDARILLKTDLGAGHGGPTGRYDAWRDEAFVLAFVIDETGAPWATRTTPPTSAAAPQRHHGSGG